jgi:hypothetical protein
MRTFINCTLHQILLGWAIREDEIGLKEERMEEMRNKHKILIQKSERKLYLGRPRRRWEVNIKTELNKRSELSGLNLVGSG